MCGRYTLTRQDAVADELQAAVAFDAAAPGMQQWWKPRYNIAPTQPAPVAIFKNDRRELRMMRWGLVPHWAASPVPGGGPKAPLMINARTEGLLGKALFRRAMERRRVLVPADGFFEWKRTKSGNRKETPQPMYFTPGRLIAFAGISVRAGDLESFAILTGPPNDLVSPIHDRMPVVLDRAAYDAWLDPTVPADAALQLIGIPDIADWHGDFVSTAVNKATTDDASCIALAAIDTKTVQGSLF